MLCLPNQPVAMDAGGYQFVRSDGEGSIGDPVPAGADSWPMPLDSQYTLTFGQDGVGTLTRSQARLGFLHSSEETRR